MSESPKLSDLEIERIVQHIGLKVAHCTAVQNVSSIENNGLRSAYDLAKHTGVDPNSIALRESRVELNGDDGTLKLNHQKPILHGLAAANRIVDGHDAHSWAVQLDKRVFFWPEKRLSAFASSIGRDVDMHVLWLDSTALLSRFQHHLWFSPINSGNFTQGGAHAGRGDWIYTNATSGLDAFKENRRSRNLVKTRDSIVEISLTCAISAPTLRQIRVDL
ncbi:DUF7002 family protein [Planktotalea sp.]|uniref:DUF7002 family protein n=1 Tax=Planktotalea sp. TaxID=2029877 RepID=UPI003F6B5F63